MQGQTVPNINGGTVVLILVFVNFYKQSPLPNIDSVCLPVSDCMLWIWWTFSFYVSDSQGKEMYSLRTQLSPGITGGRFETLLSEYKIFLKHFFHSCVLSSLTSTMTKTCEEKVTLSLPRQCIDLITSVFILQQCARGYTRLYPGPEFSRCIMCSCNGHSMECHPENGQCLVSIHICSLC